MESDDERAERYAGEVGELRACLDMMLDQITRTGRLDGRDTLVRLAREMLANQNAAREKLK